MTKLLRISVLVLALCFCSGAVPAAAQVPGPPQQGIVVTLNPRSPGPYQVVRVSIESYQVDLNASKVTWVFNGEIADQGPGLRTFAFRTGDVGTVSSLDIIVEPARGGQLRRSFSVSPSDLAMAWEADTYVPPLYRGRALLSPGANIRVSAFPYVLGTDGTRLSPEELVFRWTKDGRELRQHEGPGINSIVIENDTYIRPFTVGVIVEGPAGQRAAARTRVDVTQPKTVFYRDHPTRGVEYDQALIGTYRTQDGEVSVVAEPYYFSTNDRDRGLEHTWQMNGGKTVGEATLTVRPASETGGQSSFTLVTRHLAQFMQSARASLSLIFQ